MFAGGHLRRGTRARFLDSVWSPLATSFVAIAAAAALSPAVAGSPTLPTGGTVTSGNAAISTSGASLTVNQTSNKAIINWQGFSIGNGDSVTIENGSGATLNRVTGASSSNIDGTLTSTGSVFLVNPNGIVIGKTGVVTAGKTFVGSTLNITDSAFNASGDQTFAGSSTAAVVNEGRVGSLGGNVALIGSTTSNSGAISAPQGTAGMASGYQVTLHDSSLNGGMFSVDVGGSQTSATNTGAIKAADIELRANGGNVYALAGNTTGVIQATGASSTDGHVYLTAGETGSLTTNESITATTSTGAGGFVETSGGTVNFTGTKVNAANWLVDPTNLSVNGAAAKTIGQNLATTDVTLQTTAAGASGPGSQSPGVGNITVNSAISWSSDHTLTISSLQNVYVNAHVTSTGGGGITIYADNSATGNGTVIFGASGGLSTSGAVNLFYNPTSYATPTDFSSNVSGGATLTAYMLVNDLTQLQAINTNLSGDYALGTNIDATATSTWNSGAGFIPLGGDGAAPFTGAFNGNGYAINNLTIDDTTVTPSTIGPNNSVSINGAVGLFGVVGGSAQISSVQVTNAQVSGGDSTAVGILAGAVEGSAVVENASSSGTAMTGSEGLGAPNPSPVPAVGGLVGVLLDGATISNSSSSASATQSTGDGLGNAGGLVGAAVYGGTIENSSASGSVRGGGYGAYVGGYQGVGGLVGAVVDLVGQEGSQTVIEDSYATGLVFGGRFSLVGGLVGSAGGTALIERDYATGNASAGPGLGPGGNSIAGGLVGLTYSNATGAPTITQSYSTGISGNTLGWITAGALVGENQGTISSSYATGIVFSGVISVSGGFVGDNKGTITDCYATGVAVNDATGAGTFNGGFVGINDTTGTIADSYAIGTAVLGFVRGGFAGSNLNTGANTFSNDYWDTHTSGYSTGVGSTNVSGVTGMTTAQLQSGLPTGFLNTVWSIVPNASFPYLNWQFNGTPEVVSGNVGGDTAVQVSLATGLVETTNGYQDGFYYFLLPPNTIPSTGVLVDSALSLGGNGGAIFEDNATGSITGLNIVANTLLIQTNDANLSTVTKKLTETAAPAEGTTYSSLSNLLASVNAGTMNLDIEAGGTSGFSLDQALAAPANALVHTTSGPIKVLNTLSTTGLVTLDSSGAIGESVSGAIDAGTLSGQANGAVTLTGANLVGNLDAFANTSGGLTLDDGEQLTITSAINAGSGSLTLTTTSGDIDITNSLTTTGTATLRSAGNLVESGSGAISATTLTGYATGSVTLNGANTIGTLGTFSNKGTGLLSLSNGQTLNVAGTVVSGTGGLTLTTTSGDLDLTSQIKSGAGATLNSAGALTESGSGAVSAASLSGSANGVVSLNGANLFDTLGAFSSNDNGISVTDGKAFTTSGAINAGTGTLSLVETAGTLLSVRSAISGATVNLTSDTGELTETSAGTITATQLNAVANTGIVLTSATNAITNVGTDTTTTGPNKITK